MGYRVNTPSQIWDELNGPVDGYSFGLGMFASALALAMISLILEKGGKWLCGLVTFVVRVTEKLQIRRRSSQPSDGTDKPTPLPMADSTPTLEFMAPNQTNMTTVIIRPSEMPTLSNQIPGITQKANAEVEPEYTGKHRNND